MSFYVVKIISVIPLVIRHIYARVEYIMFCGAIIRIAGLFNYFIRRGIWLRTIDNIVCLPAEYLQSFHHPIVTLNNGGEQYNITLCI